MTIVRQRMDETAKRAWTKALRSGDYIQGQGLLRSAENEWCCLGVLLDVDGAGKWDRTGPDDIYTFYPLIGYPDSSNLPALDAQRLGIAADVESELVNMNDGDEWSFATIADWIDANL